MSQCNRLYFKKKKEKKGGGEPNILVGNFLEFDRLRINGSKCERSTYIWEKQKNRTQVGLLGAGSNTGKRI